ncbi:50S ribosomal protein L25 [Iodidimonas gelatinilytica]|uniref:Large ribosomal subunit protein bL25 n=2 Tax=Iodidimonas gelatinilytica TaxID=1236966 RepID=A0A5A7MPM2_9PROT|nr:50S ribosomal protein L25 [Iodidimonas gelatinilytica]GEQ99870.1 50S ribosomal protein L25 [Iodidimonas gelatinilytica]
MAQALTLNVLPRDKAGKGSARAARRDGLVPAVIYGAKKPPVMVTIKLNELIALLNRGGFLSHQYELSVDGKKERVLPRDIQLHPVTDTPLHVDFLRLAKGSKVTVEVPVHFFNEEKCAGLKRGGVLNIVRHEVELNVPATDIPESIDIDLASFDVGDSIKISTVSLPEGCEPTITDRDFTIATIAAPSSMRSEESEESEEAETEESSED